MSAAVRERKEEARKAKKSAGGGADSGGQTLITRVADSLERLGGEHGFDMVTALWIYSEVQRAAQAYEQNGETEAFGKVGGKFLRRVVDKGNSHGSRIIGHVNLSHPSGFEVGDEVSTLSTAKAMSSRLTRTAASGSSGTVSVEPRTSKPSSRREAGR